MGHECENVRGDITRNGISVLVPDGCRDVTHHFAWLLTNEIVMLPCKVDVPAEITLVALNSFFSEEERQAARACVAGWALKEVARSWS